MISTLLQILPLAVGATFSPSGLLLVIGILSGKDRPRRRALAFTAGSALFLLALGLALLLILKPAIHAAPHSHRVSAVIDLVLGGFIILTVAYSALFRRGEKPQKERKRRVPYGLLGFSFMLVNTSTLVLYVAACKVIIDSGHGLFRSLILLVILIAITMLLIALPVATAFIFPRGSDRILAPVSKLMSRYGSRVARIYFLAMGVYLIIRGVTLLD